jgi:hypothetical protein
VTTRNSTPPAPSAPSAAPAAINITTTSATIYWSSVPGATGYELYRGGVLVYSGPNVTFTDTGLSPNTVYGYTARAYNAYAVSPHGPLGAVMTLRALSGTPGPPVASNLTNTSLWLTWDPVDGATGYELYRGSTLIYSGPNRIFMVANLTPGTTYSFTLRATNLAGASPFSTPCVVTTWYYW